MEFKRSTDSLIRFGAEFTHDGHRVRIMERGSSDLHLSEL
jgi:hypothetical protein